MTNESLPRDIFLPSIGTHKPFSPHSVAQNSPPTPTPTSSEDPSSSSSREQQGPASSRRVLTVEAWVAYHLLTSWPVVLRRQMQGAGYDPSQPHSLPRAGEGAAAAGERSSDFPLSDLLAVVCESDAESTEGLGALWRRTVSHDPKVAVAVLEQLRNEQEEVTRTIRGQTAPRKEKGDAVHRGVGNHNEDDEDEVYWFLDRLLLVGSFSAAAATASPHGNHNNNSNNSHDEEDCDHLWLHWCRVECAILALDTTTASSSSSILLQRLQKHAPNSSSSSPGTAAAAALLFTWLLLWQYGHVSVTFVAEQIVLLIDDAAAAAASSPSSSSSLSAIVEIVLFVLLERWSTNSVTAARCAMLLSAVLRLLSTRARAAAMTRAQLQYSSSSASSSSSSARLSTTAPPNPTSVAFANTLLQHCTDIFDSVFLHNNAVRKNGFAWCERAFSSLASKDHFWMLFLPALLSQLGYEWPWSSWVRLARTAVNQKFIRKTTVEALWKDLFTAVVWRSACFERLASVIPQSLMPYVEELGADAEYRSFGFGTKRRRAEDEGGAEGSGGTKKGTPTVDAAVDPLVLNRYGLLYRATIADGKQQTSSSTSSSSLSKAREELFCRLRTKLRQTPVTDGSLPLQITQAMDTFPQLVQLRAQAAMASLSPNSHALKSQVEAEMVLVRAELLLSLLCFVTDGFLVRGYLQPLLVHVFGPLLEQLRGQWMTHFAGAGSSFSSTMLSSSEQGETERSVPLQWSAETLWGHGLLAMWERADMTYSERRLLSVRLLRALTQNLLTTTASTTTTTTTTGDGNATAAAARDKVSFFATPSQDLIDVASLIVLGLYKKVDGSGEAFEDHSVGLVVRRSPREPFGLSLAHVADHVGNLLAKQEGDWSEQPAKLPAAIVVSADQELGFVRMALRQVERRLTEVLRLEGLLQPATVRSVQLEKELWEETWMAQVVR